MHVDLYGNYIMGQINLKNTFFSLYRTKNWYNIMYFNYCNTFSRKMNSFGDKTCVAFFFLILNFSDKWDIKLFSILEFHERPLLYQ
jgi:hypothetical protein